MNKIVLLLAFILLPIVTRSQSIEPSLAIDTTKTITEDKIVRWDHYYNRHDPRGIDVWSFDDADRFSPRENYEMQYKTVRVPALAPIFKSKWDSDGYYYTNGGLAEG